VLSVRKAVKNIPYSIANSLLGTKGTSRRPIFVAGNGRSGTSWIGETLGQAENVLYYREPCQPRRNGLRAREAEAVWSRYVPPGARDPFFEATLGAAFRGHFWPGSGHRLADYRGRLARRPQVIVKEVAAFPSTEWVVERWDPMVLIIFRHPAAYAASVRNLKQDAEELGRLRLLCAEPSLREGRLAARMRRLEGIEDPLEASVASWGIRTSVVLEALGRHPDWLVVHYEDLARDPIPGFRALYAKLGLTWDGGLEAWVRGRISADSGGTYSTARLSASRIDAWRGQLSPGEIARVRRILALFELPLYAAATDWAA
jgi:hypothetical protein